MGRSSVETVKVSGEDDFAFEMEVDGTSKCLLCGIFHRSVLSGSLATCNAAHQDRDRKEAMICQEVSPLAINVC